MTERPAVRPIWTTSSVVLWSAAALAPLLGFVFLFLSGLEDWDRLRNASLAWLIGGTFSLLVGLIGVIFRRRPVRWPDPVLILYGFVFAYTGFARCGMATFGSHPCW